MRFISPIKSYRIVAIHEQIEQLASGLPRLISPGFACEFKHGDTTDWEREEGMRRFKFRGQTLNLDGTATDMRNRISSFDTATIEDKRLRERVEQALLSNPDFGKPDGYILVEKPRLAAPWTAYDELVAQGRRTPELVAQKNLETAEATGVPVEALIAYERENRADPKILAAYEEALAAASVADEADELVTA